MSMHQPDDPNPITQLIDDLKEVMSEIDTEANARAEGDLAVKDWCAQLIEKALDKAVAQLEQKIDSADEKAELTTRALVKDEVKNALGNSLSELQLDLVDQRVLTDNSYRLPNVDYDFNQSQVTPELRVALDALLAILVDHPKMEVQLIGHTASFGNDDKNLRLSQERARAAADYLVGRGVATHRISPSGVGESQLLNECVNGILCSIEQHKVNERLELKVLRY